LVPNSRDPYDLVPITEKPKFDQKQLFKEEIERGERNQVSEFKSTQEKIKKEIAE